MLPQHVALIMDGNRRWAKERNLPEIEGYRAGVNVIRLIIQEARKKGITVLTFWAFSTENWQRPPREVADLMTVFREFLQKKDLFEKFKEEGGVVRILGDLTRFPLDIQKTIAFFLKKEESAPKLILNFGLNYGGRAEILRAVGKIIQAEISQEQLSEELFGRYLYTVDQPDVDLLIRTGGEMRLSGLMPWQSAYAELYFTKTLWPDFTSDEFEKALFEFGRRQRNFGR